jgi:hypothetical protein
LWLASFSSSVCLLTFARLLHDLDEELLYELDMICQENQLARYPVSRGRNSQDFAFEKYPELVSLVENDRQRRIDSMRLRSRLDQDELHDERIRAASLDKSMSSPSARKTKPSQASGRKISVNSPVLKPKQSAGDLMFQMDEEGTMSPTPLRKGLAPPGGSISEEMSDYPQIAGPSLVPGQPKLSQSDSLGERSYLDDNMGLIDSAGVGTPTKGLTPTPQRVAPGSPTPGSSISRVPWASPVISGGKRDLKGIMTETSQSRISNLTLGMSDRQNNTSVGNFSPKLSQRERKKLQQQQIQESLTAEKKPKESPQSPWQTPTKQTASTAPEPPVEPGWGRASSDQVKTAQKPSMTLRQTVAGVPPTRPVAGPSPSQNQGRSVSSPLPTPPRPVKPVQPTPGPQQQPSPSLSSPAQPVIQSIRHTPRPDRSRPSFAGSASGQLSLTSILLLQQAEKDEIREAATAKHNLQDIQLEQEFQEWWDQESKRVMQQAEAEAAEAAAKERRGQRSRGKNRGQRKDGARGKDAGTSEAHPDTVQPSGGAASVATEKGNASKPRSKHPRKTDEDGNSDSHRGRGRPRPSKGKERAHSTQKV